jgi:hypothetical protein
MKRSEMVEIIPISKANEAEQRLIDEIDNCQRPYKFQKISANHDRYHIERYKQEFATRRESNIIAKNATIDDRAYIVGSFIGDRATIGRATIIRSKVYDGCTVRGPNTNINCSILWFDAKIGDSVTLNGNLIGTCVNIRDGLRSAPTADFMETPYYADVFGKYSIYEVSPLGYLNIGCQCHHILLWKKYLNAIAYRHDIRYDLLKYYDWIVNDYFERWIHFAFSTSNYVSESMGMRAYPDILAHCTTFNARVQEAKINHVKMPIEKLIQLAKHIIFDLEQLSRFRYELSKQVLFATREQVDEFDGTVAPYVQGWEWEEPNADDFLELEQEYHEAIGLLESKDEEDED